MRNTKYTLPSFAFYDRSGIQNYLEKQAAKGWLLEHAGNFFWKFRRIDPRKLHFAVVYFPKADMYDPAPGEAEQTFREFCAHGGWTLAGANAQMQIFYSQRENPTPIETDPVLEVENIHRSMKKSALPAYWILVINCLIQFWLLALNLDRGLVFYLSSGLNLFLAVVWPGLFVISILRLLCYYRWCRRAKAAGERDGVFLETRSVMWAEKLLSVLILMGFALLLLTMEDRRIALVMGLNVALISVAMLLVELLRRKLKKYGYDAAANRKFSIITSVVLTFGVMVILVPMIVNAVMGDQPEGSGEDLKLNIWELLGEDEEGYGTLNLTDQESLLLGYQRIYQYTEGNTRSHTLEYNLVDVKASFLYAGCLEDMLVVPAYMENGTFRPTDPTPWGAEQAWQLHDGEAFREWYLICYENAILELVPDWEMTPEQKDQVGELIK